MQSLTKIKADEHVFLIVILTSLSLLWWRWRSQSDRGHGRISVSSLALLSTTQASWGVGWALRDHSREVRQREKHQAGRINHPYSRWKQRHLFILKTQHENSKQNTFLNATMFWYNWLIYSPSLYKKKRKRKKRLVSLKSTSDRENYLDCFL